MADRLLSLIPSGYNLLVPILAILLTCGSSLYFEHHYDGLAQMEKVAQAEAKVIQVQGDMQKVSDDYEAKLLEAQNKTNTVYVNIEKEVPVYVTKKADSNCVITNGFVKLYDYAATPSVSDIPKSTPSTNDDATHIKLSDVAESITDNFKTCNEIRDQLINLQDWVKDEQNKMNENVSQ